MFYPERDAVSLACLPAGFSLPIIDRCRGWFFVILEIGSEFAEFALRVVCGAICG